MSLPDDQQPRSFEDALKELEAIVERLEKGNVALDEMLALYKKGRKLSSYCEDKLQSARKTIESMQTSESTESRGDSLPTDPTGPTDTDPSSGHR